MKKFARGDAFIKEPTGSATRINLDGEVENNFNVEPVAAKAAEKTIQGKVSTDRRPVR